VGVRGRGLFLAVLGVVLVNLAIIYCYRRSTKREYNQNMQVHIDSAVNQYFALSQDKQLQYQMR